MHVVVTAREPLGLFTSSWQESLKNKATTPLADYGRTESDDPRAVWDWRALDLGLVLDRWAPAVPPERLHVIAPPPPGSAREELWERFAGVLGIDPDVVRRHARLRQRLDGRGRGRDAAPGQPAPHAASTPPAPAGAWLRTFLADERLVPRQGERFWPDDDQVADARARGERAVERLRAASYDVVGDLDLLLVPDDLPPRRHPDSVTDAEVAEVAVDLVADADGRPAAAYGPHERSRADPPSRLARLRQALRGV